MQDAGAGVLREQLAGGERLLAVAGGVCEGRNVVLVDLDDGRDEGGAGGGLGCEPGNGVRWWVARVHGREQVRIFVPRPDPTPQGSRVTLLARVRVSVVVSNSVGSRRKLSQITDELLHRAHLNKSEILCWVKDDYYDFYRTACISFACVTLSDSLSEKVRNIQKELYEKIEAASSCRPLLDYLIRIYLDYTYRL